MKTLIVFGTLLAVAFGFPQHGRSTSRIIGGKAVSNINDFPYQLSLQKVSSHFCGASYLGGIFALSAAHCVQNVNLINVVGGTLVYNSGGEKLRVSAWVGSPDYKSRSIQYDFSIITLDGEFSSSVVKSIPYSSQDPTVFQNYGVTSGWGVTTVGGGHASETLQWVALPILSNDDCKAFWGPSTNPSVICAGAQGSGFGANGVGACNGDSGGPLVYYTNAQQPNNAAEPTYASDAVLIGDVSYGLNGCSTDKPTAFGRVSAGADWIETTTGISGVDLSGVDN